MARSRRKSRRSRPLAGSTDRPATIDEPPTVLAEEVGPALEAVPNAASLAEEPSAQTLRKRDLIERLTAETGLKRRDVRAVTEALLAALGESVAKGESLSLEPFGKLRVARSAEGTGSRTHTCKLRQKNPALATAAE
ncbi:MAG: HU family DNA-binding protein [Pseudomonadota bacterium]